MTAESTPKRIVIVGAGFAGVACAQGLAAHAAHAGLSITLIDKNPYHQFQPMLYQVATSQLGPGDLAYSLHKLFAKSPQVEVVHAEAAAVDPLGRTVVTKTGDVHRGDYLVLAAGALPNFFNTPGAEELAFPLYTLDNADRLRARILEVYEEADRDPSRIAQGGLNVVIVGAGPTGVETAGALADLVHNAMPGEYPQMKKGVARIFIVDHGKAVLGAFSPEAHAYAAKVLEASGVELRLGVLVKDVAADHVLLSDGTTIPTRLVIWAGGSSPVPFAGLEALPKGRGGRFDVERDFTIAGFPGLMILGDLANIPDATGATLPQLGSVALQSGQWAARNVLAEIAGKPRAPFVYDDKGFMAMINRNAAIVELGAKRHELHGHLAVAAWVGVHAYLMTGARNRLDAVVSWIWNRFSHGPKMLDRSNKARLEWDEDKDEG